jgi:phosphopantetheine adenylyltransferase
MEDRNGDLITDKMMEALVLLEERTRAIRVRLERIEARLKELEEEDK